MNLFSEHLDSDKEGAQKSNTEAESEEEDDIRLPTSEEYLALSNPNHFFEQQIETNSGQLEFTDQKKIQDNEILRDSEVFLANSHRFASTDNNEIQKNGPTEDDETNDDISDGLFCLLSLSLRKCLKHQFQSFEYIFRTLR